ncbi:MAG: hypothetical protein GX121_10075 [Ignavibacteria bacterium]|nr:hypothetical protein [Ignavibacteria bacterium]
MKKKVILLFAIALVTTALLASNEVLEYFNANSDGKVITVQWKALDESFVSKYELERSQNNGTYKKIHTQEPSNSSYSFVDDEAYLKTASDESTEIAKTNYSYRIKIIKKDNSHVYSTTQSVSHSINSIRRTWGMIKEMFR